MNGDDGQVIASHSAASGDAASGNAASGSPGSDSIELRVPADPAYLAVIRTAAAGLAARLELTLDEIEDLRIAVDDLVHRLRQWSRAAAEVAAELRSCADRYVDIDARGAARIG